MQMIGRLIETVGLVTISIFFAKALQVAFGSLGPIDFIIDAFTELLIFIFVLLKPILPFQFGTLSCVGLLVASATLAIVLRNVLKGFQSEMSFLQHILFLPYVLAVLFFTLGYQVSGAAFEFLLVFYKCAESPQNYYGFSCKEIEAAVVQIDSGYRTIDESTNLFNVIILSPINNTMSDFSWFIFGTMYAPYIGMILLIILFLIGRFSINNYLVKMIISIGMSSGAIAISLVVDRWVSI